MGVCATPGFGLPAECAVEGLELLEAEAAVPVQIVFVKRLLRALRGEILRPWSTHTRSQG